MNPLLGILLQILAVLAFTIQGALVRYFGGRFPLGEMVFARSTIALIPVLLMLSWQGKLRSALRTKNLMGHVTRSFTNVGGMFFNYAGLTRIPLADATAIGHAMPLFTVVLAWMFLGELVRLWRWTAVVVGLIGVLVMLSPYLGQGASDAYNAWGAIFCLVAAFLFGVALTQVRHMAATETTGSLVFYYSVIASLVSLTTIFWGWVVPSATDFVLLIGLGVVGGIAQILMTESFRYAAAAVLAPFAYTSMLWAVAIGYVWFDEIPAAIVLLGAAIVIGSGLVVIWREHKLGLDRKRAKNQSAPPPV
ncbi:MAG: DMT family transporter [Xanthobacteraceae bacterium]